METVTENLATETTMRRSIRRVVRYIFVYKRII